MLSEYCWIEVETTEEEYDEEVVIGQALLRLIQTPAAIFPLTDWLRASTSAVTIPFAEDVKRLLAIADWKLGKPIPHRNGNDANRPPSIQLM